MRRITPEQQAILAERHGQEFWYVVEIDWPDGLHAYSSVREEGVEPLLLTISDMHNTMRSDGFGETSVIQVTLNDAYGNFKYYVDSLELTNIKARVGIRGKDFYLPMLFGHIEHPIAWSEAARTLSFTITPFISDGLVGYAPNIADVTLSTSAGFRYTPLINYKDFGFNYSDTSFVSSLFFRTKARLNGKVWPTVFGHCENVPIEPIAISPSCKVSREIWDVTGGWAARAEAINWVKEAKEYNERYTLEIIAGSKDRRLYIPIPEASGLIIMQVDSASTFEQFEQLLVSIEFEDQLIVAKGRFYSAIQGQHVNFVPSAPNGYFVIQVGPYAASAPLHLTGQVPDNTRVPVGWPFTVPNLSGYQDFNIPVYENIRVMQQRAEDTYVVDSEAWPIPMTQDQKNEIILRSLSSKTLENLPSYLQPWDGDQLVDILDGNKFGYKEDKLTKFHVVGILDDTALGGKVMPDFFPKGDYPWLSRSWIEAEVVLGKRKGSLDKTLDSTGISNPVTWNDDGQIGYALMPVISQRGFECTVYNPDQFEFRRIKTVYKNNILHKRRDDKATISAKRILEREPESKKGVIPVGSIIRFFNWLPEQQFVVDTKKETSVLAVKYINETGDEYIALPEASYSVTDAEQGTIWAGYHPACTVVTLSYNGMMRYRFDAKRNNGELFVDTNNRTNTDERIAYSAVKSANDQAGDMSFEVDLTKARPNSLFLTEILGIKEFLTSLAFQNGKIVLGSGNSIRFASMMTRQKFVGEITENKIVEKSVTLGYTDSVFTVFDISIKSSNANDPVFQTIRKHNVRYFGQRNKTLAFNVYHNIAGTYNVTDFWIYYLSTYWRKVSLKATFECAGFQVGDIVKLVFNQSLTFSTPYAGVSGPVEAPPEGASKLYSSFAMIESMKFNIADATIDITLWTPIKPGHTTADTLMWSRRVVGGISTLGL